MLLQKYTKADHPPLLKFSGACEGTKLEAGSSRVTAFSNEDGNFTPRV